MESFGKKEKENHQRRIFRKPMQHQMYDMNSPFLPFSKIDQNLGLQKRNTFSGDEFCSEKSAFKPFKRATDMQSQKM